MSYVWVTALLITFTIPLHSRILLSELHDAYFTDPVHVRKVLALLRVKQTAQRLSEVQEVCYFHNNIQCMNRECTMVAYLRMWDMSNNCLHNTLASKDVKFLCCHGCSSKSCHVRMIWKVLVKEIIVCHAKRYTQNKRMNTKMLELIAPDRQNHTPNVIVGRLLCDVTWLPRASCASASAHTKASYG